MTTSELVNELKLLLPREEFIEYCKCQIALNRTDSKKRFFWQLVLIEAEGELNNETSK